MECGAAVGNATLRSRRSSAIIYGPHLTLLLMGRDETTSIEIPMFPQIILA